LRMLYDKYHADGFELIAFPANQFGGQAPGSSEEERAWAIKKFGFEFPVFDKIGVLDKPSPLWDTQEESPVYKFMKAALPGEIPWNYTKFLIGRDGVPLRRYSPADPLDQGMEDDVKAALAGKPLRKRRSEK
jgi:glutathione peroxidase